MIYLIIIISVIIGFVLGVWAYSSLQNRPDRDTIDRMTSGNYQEEEEDDSK